MESPDSGLASLLSIIASPEATYTDPATGETLHNTGRDIREFSDAQDGAKIISFPLRSFIE